MNEANCVPFLCKQQIHSLSEWRKAALNKKKELQNDGINAYEAHPEYQMITKCKPDDSVFPSMSYCNQAYPKQASPSKKASTPGKKANTGKKSRCPKGTRFNKKTQNCKPKNNRSSPSKRASTPNKKANTGKRARCPKGTRFNKKTQNCKPK
jgi:hypothetical protein